jgi:hypothetical protein
LVVGLLYAVFYALMLFSMSSGMLGESTALDHAASKTFLDIGGECDEINDEPWIHMFPNEEQHAFSLAGHNLPEGYASLTYQIESMDEDTAAWSETNATVKAINPTLPMRLWSQVGKKFRKRLSLKSRCPSKRLHSFRLSMMKQSKKFVSQKLVHDRVGAFKISATGATF